MSKKAFIFGSNYKDTSKELNACVSDCKKVSEKLTSRGFKVEKRWSGYTLNATEIGNQLSTFIKSLSANDKGVIYYSGHGTQALDKNSDELDGYDECLYLGQNQLISDDILVSKLKLAVKGTKIITVFDCCNSGTIFDLPFRLKDFGIKRENYSFFDADILCISGCSDLNISYEKNGSGLLTDSFLKILDTWKPNFFPSMPAIDFYIRVASDLLTTSENKQYAQLAFNNYKALESIWL